MDYSKLLDEQNMFDLFSPKPNNQNIRSEGEVALDAEDLSKHLVSEGLSKAGINDFVEELLILMEPEISSKQF